MTNRASGSCWFEDLMGFADENPEQVRAQIEHRGEELHSLVNGRMVRCGNLEIPSLAELRQSVDRHAGRKRAEVHEVVGDAGDLHRDERNAGTLFQVASQFNLLEMADPSLCPEDGVGIYERDRTQGPSCAIACGGGTIYRNYFVRVAGAVGQSAERQVDCLAELGAALGGPGLWRMSNGYALVTREGLEHVNAKLAASSRDELNELRGLLRVGVQRDVEVLGTQHCVTQIYCSALPVAYGASLPVLWEPFARLVLEAAYEATFLAARLHGIESVHLTLLGGGVFGNDPSWIGESILRALDSARGLRVVLVSHREPQVLVEQIIRSHAMGRTTLT